MKAKATFKQSVFPYAFLLLALGLSVPDSALAASCPAGAGEITDGNIIVHSARNEFQIVEHDGQTIPLNRDTRIHVSYVIQGRDRSAHRAVALLRKTEPSEHSTNNSEVKISNNLRKFFNILSRESIVNKELYDKHHSSKTESRTILRYFHVPFRNYLTNSFHNTANNIVFRGFFAEEYRNFWARMHRYRGMRGDTMCATFVLYIAAAPPPGVIDQAFFRIIDLSEATPYATSINFQVSFH